MPRICQITRYLAKRHPLRETRSKKQCYHVTKCSLNQNCRLDEFSLILREKYLPETVKKSKKHKSIQLRIWRLNTPLK